MRSLDVSISSQCAAAIDVLAANTSKRRTPSLRSGAGTGGSSDQSLRGGGALSAAAAHPGLFLDVLRTLFDIVLFEDANQWSLFVRC